MKVCFKRGLCILLVFILALGLVACGAGGDTRELQGQWNLEIRSSQVPQSEATAHLVTFNRNQFTAVWYEWIGFWGGGPPIGSYTNSIRTEDPFQIFGSRQLDGRVISSGSAGATLRFEVAGTFTVSDGRIEFLPSDEGVPGIADFQVTENTLELNEVLLIRQ